MTPKLLVAAAEILDWAAKRRLPACLIGGMAVQRWGEPRLTRDVDVTICTGWEVERSVLSDLLGSFRPRRQGMAAFALQNRVVLIHASNGIPVDVALGGFSFEDESVERASPYAFAPGVSLLTCSAEDLVIMKVFAGRPVDLLDVEGIVIRQGKALDARRVRRWLKALAELKEDPALARPFEEAVRKARRLRR